jgi:hypothetical protein
MNEGLSFEPVPEPPEQNRLFIIIAIGLVGMLVLGLLGIGGYVVFSRSKRSSQAQRAAQATPIVLLATDTPTVMATVTPLPTKTSTPVQTNTPVVLLSKTTPAVVALQQSTQPVETQIVVIENPTATPISGSTAPTTSIPDAGFGLGVLGLGAGLAAVVFVSHRLRVR